jgi:hypothetical protein
LLWYLLSPVLAVIVGNVGEFLVRVADWHDLTRTIDIQGDQIYVQYIPASSDQALIIGYRRFSYGIVLLIALILAVPDVRWRLRLKILLLGSAMMFSLQVFRFAALVLDHYGQHVRHLGEPIYPMLYRRLLHYADKLMLRLEGHVIPLLIWAGLYLYYQWYRRFLQPRKKR